MALTIPQLAYRLRIQADDTTAVTGATLNELTALKAVSDAYIERYASSAPEDVKDEATVLFAGYLYDGPETDPGGAAVAYPAAWRNSGAQALLSTWRAQRAGVIGAAAAAAVTVADPGNPIIGARITGSNLILMQADGGTITLALPEGGGSSVGGGGLTRGERATLDGAVQLESIELVGRDLTFTDSGSNAETITLPGITVEDEGADQGAVTEVNFTGAGVTARRAGVKATITIPGVGDIASNPAVVGLREFEASLRHESDIVRTATVAVAIGLASYAIPGAPKLPGADADRELIITVGTNESITIDLSALLAKPAVASVGPALSSTNAVEWTAGGVTYLLARRAGTGEFLFGADTVGSYSVTIVDSVVDVSPFARRSTAAKLPAAKLPTVTGTHIATNQRLPGPEAGMWLRWNAAATALENVDAEARIDERIDARATPIDVIAESEFTVVAVSTDRGIANLALQFNAGTTSVTIGQVVRLASGLRLSVTVTPFNTRAAVAPYHIQIGDIRLAFADATYNVGGLSNPDSYTWELASIPVWNLDESITVAVFEPIDSSNYVPGGEAGDNGKPLIRAADGPTWATLAPGGLGLTGGAGRLVRVNDDGTGFATAVLSGLIEIQNGPITGLTITNLSQSQRSAAAFLSDSVATGNGEYHAELVLTVTARSEAQRSLSIDGISAADSVRLTGLTFRSSVRGVQPYNSREAIGLTPLVTGVLVGEVRVVNANTLGVSGYIRLYLVRNASNALGYVLEYWGNTGGTGNVTISANLVLSFLASDSAGGSAPAPVIPATWTVETSSIITNDYVSVNPYPSGISLPNNFTIAYFSVLRRLTSRSSSERRLMAVWQIFNPFMGSEGAGTMRLAPLIQYEASFRNVNLDIAGGVIRVRSSKANFPQYHQFMLVYS